MRNTMSFLGIWVLVAALFCACEPQPVKPDQPGSTVKDVDGNLYHTVTIGGQTWMSEDLKVLHLPNGFAMKLLEPYPNRINEPSYVLFGGRVLYNALAAQFGADTLASCVQGVCPDGWHLPTTTEWQQLIDYVEAHPECRDSSGFVSRALADQHWGDSSLSASFNQTGFSALPTGYAVSYPKPHMDVFETRWVNRGCAYYWSTDHNAYYPRPSDGSQSPWDLPQWGYIGADSLEVQSFVFVLDTDEELPGFSSLPDVHYCAIRCVKDR